MEGRDADSEVARIAKFTKERIESDSEDMLKLAERIGNALRTRGIQYTIHDLETIVRLYKAASYLGKGIPVEKLVLTVLARDPESEHDLKRRFTTPNQYSRKAIVEKVAHKPLKQISFRKTKKLKNDKLWESYISGKKSSIASRSPLEPGNRLRQGHIPGLDKDSMELLNYTKKFLESENEGYLDMIEERLSTLTKRSSSDTGEGREPGIGVKRGSANKVFYESLKKLVENPKSHDAIIGIAYAYGHFLAPYIVKYVTGRKFGDRNSAKILRYIGMKYSRKMAKHVLDRRLITYSGHTFRRTKRVSLRYTIFNYTRLKIGHITYKEPRYKNDFLIILDRSDSMKKYSENIIRILLAIFDKSGFIITFSDSIKKYSLKNAVKTPMILQSILSEGFHGYTDVIKALKEGVRHARRKTVIIISDFEQTIETTERLGRHLYRLIMVANRVVIYTTPRGQVMVSNELEKFSIPNAVPLQRLILKIL